MSNVGSVIEICRAYMERTELRCTKCAKEHGDEGCECSLYSRMQGVPKKCLFVVGERRDVCSSYRRKAPR